MEDFILTKENLVCAQVCTEKSYDDALWWIRANYPAGTKNNWCKNEDERYKPVKCEKYPERNHYLFVC